jgi:hypothetical protein
VVAGHGLDRLRDRHALAGQGGLLDLERRGDEQAAVGRDLVARLERDDVAGHELLGRDLGQLASPPHVRLDDQHLLERGDALGCLAFLVQPEDRVHHRQGEDDDAGAELLQGRHADDRRAHEDELHQVAVLAQESPPTGLLLSLGELVRAELRAPPFDVPRV